MKETAKTLRTMEKSELEHFITTDDFSNLSGMLKECHKSYILKEPSEDGDEIQFEVRVEHIEKLFRTFDNKPCYGTSRDFACKLSGKSSSWGIHWGKNEIDGIGISDSFVYKLFDSLINKYYTIIINGVYGIIDGGQSIKIKDLEIQVID